MNVSIFKEPVEKQARKVVVLLIILISIELFVHFLLTGKLLVHNFKSLIRYMNLWVTIAVVLGVCIVNPDGVIESDSDSSALFKKYVEWGFLIGLFIYVPMVSFSSSGVGGLGLLGLPCIIYGILLTIILSVINYKISEILRI